MFFNSSEEFRLFSYYLAEQEVGEATCAEAEVLVGEPLLAEHLFYYSIVGDGVAHRVDTASRFESNLNASLVVVLLDGLTHDVGCLWGGGYLLFASRGLDVVGTGIHG